MEFGELLTVPGAALAAGVLTQVAKALGMPGSWAKRFALISAMSVLLVAVAIQGGATGADWFLLAVFVAPTAGMAAWGAYDAIR